MLPPITTGLTNQLDASVLLLSGFSNGQTLIAARVPDQVSASGWTGSGYDISVVANGSPSGLTTIQSFTGNLFQNNWSTLLSASGMTVTIAAMVTGPSYVNAWMGLYNLSYREGKHGICMMAITNNLNSGTYTGWGLYNNLSTYQSTSAMTINTPMSVTVVGNADGSGTFYTNGSACGTYPSVVSVPGSFTASKGQGYTGLGGLQPSGGSFVGEIYEVLIYSRSLSASEVASNASYLASKWFTGAPHTDMYFVNSNTITLINNQQLTFV